MSRSLLFLLLLIPTLVLAQDEDSSSGFDRLADELRDESSARWDAFYGAWDAAVADGRYARADSIAVLARLEGEADTGIPYDSLAWPSPADALALRFLRGDPAALDWIAEDGRWWQDFVTWDGESATTYTMGAEVWYVDPGAVTREALSRDVPQVLALFQKDGRAEEDIEAAQLAMARLGAALTWGEHTLYVEGQDDLNDRADAFLRAFPRSRYERFARDEVRRRYRPAGALVVYADLGGTGATGTLGGETTLGLGAAFGVGVRAGWAHLDVSGRLGQRYARETLVQGTETVVEDEALQVGLVGLSAGPRVVLGRVEVLPYASVGVLAQDIVVAEEETRFSTYEPPTRASWGYGLALEYRPTPAPGSAAAFGIRVGVNRLHPRLNRGFEDVLSGAITTVTVGMAARLETRRRVR